MKDQHNKISIPFLLNYTKSDTTTLPDTFGRLSLKETSKDEQYTDALSQWDLVGSNNQFPAPFLSLDLGERKPVSVFQLELRGACIR
jgi:hypothetical protein